MTKKESKFGLIVHDGVNLFYNSKWTGIEVDDVESGKQLIGFLETLTDEQVEHWIRVEKFKNGGHKTFAVLKNNTKYSGQTTAYEHKHGDKWKETPFAGPDCIQATNLFDVQWSNCPVEVQDEVRDLWGNHELGNDRYIYKWSGDEEEKEEYPVIAEYLESRGVTKCLIHWWW